MGFCYQKNFSNPTMPVDEAQFYALVRGTEWGEKIDKFRETGDQAIKRKLPASRSGSDNGRTDRYRIERKSRKYHQPQHW